MDDYIALPQPIEEEFSPFQASASSSSSSLPPHFILSYITLILLTCTALIILGIFIEAVATVTKRTLLYITTNITKPTAPIDTPIDMSKSRRKLQAALFYFETPRALLHQVMDRICPVKSHTPSETPPQRVPQQGLPEMARSPCLLCHDGIGMGALKRRLPCGHTFHARCIDAIYMTDGMPIDSEELNGSFRCPQCEFCVFPTPDLIHDDLIFT